MNKIAVNNWRPIPSLEILQQRARLMTRVRNWFLEQGFLEVQTPVLTRECIIDRYVEPVQVPLVGETFYLHTSPEFAMKRLLAAGMTKIWQMCPVFRTGENGRRHNTEFTMLEWYETGINYEQGRDFLAAFFMAMTGATSCRQSPYEDTLAGITGLDFSSSTSEIREYAIDMKLSFPESWLAESGADRSDWLDLVMDASVLPRLTEPTILYDFPEQDSQLARLRTVERRGRKQQVSARYELYVQGLELANGYDELTDPEELHCRFEQRQNQRITDGRQRLPDGERLLAAMRHGFPATCGCALGFDRLFMLVAGLDSIDQTIAFPYDRA